MIEQRSEEWHKARYGWATASRLGDLMAKAKSGESASRAKYKAQVICERLTNQPYSSGFNSAAMQRGTEKEPIAIQAYEALKLCEVKPASFIRHPSIHYAGASPDGFVGGSGLIEVKSPESHTHWNTLKTEKIDRRYMLQMQFQMACTERDWCDFVSFDDRFPPEFSIFVKRVDRDEDMINNIENEVIKFLEEVKAEIESAQGRQNEAGLQI